MGIKESVEWLTEDEEARKIFISIAEGGKKGLSPIELHELLGREEWWPLKRILKGLVEQGMVEQTDGNFKPTGEGEKVMTVLTSLKEVEKTC